MDVEHLPGGSPLSQIVNDPVHGVIELPKLCIDIIDTPEFQRLRFIKQLGGSYFVYPGAAHNRFEHSIGVCYLAGQLLEAIKRRQPELGLTVRDIELVQVAGLCHDMGHGPFSHMFEALVLPKLQEGEELDSAMKHEDLSVKMFDHMLSKKDFNFKENEKTFVRDLIGGPHKGEKYEKWINTRTYLLPEKILKKKMFLYEVVNNKRNGIDVDKWDYFARDCHMLGLGNNFSHRRCIATARVICVQKDQWQICYRDKEYNSLLEMFHTRYQLHRRAYQHKTCNSIEMMIANAVLAAAPHIEFQYEDGPEGKVTVQRKLSEVTTDMNAYTLMTDDIFYRILNSGQKMSTSKKLLTRILKRDLYRCVKEIPVEGSQSSEYVRKLKAILEKEELTETDDFWIDTVKLNYGNKTTNPMDKVNFYHKDEPDEAGPIAQKSVSHLLPSSWEETLIRVYSKTKESKEKVENACKEWDRPAGEQ